MRLIIDGDILLYKIGCSHDKPVQFGDDAPIMPDVSAAKDAFVLFIDDMKKTLKADKITLCFTTGRSWRYDIWDKYKANRPKERPEIVGKLKTWAMVHYAQDLLVRDGFEADDLLGLSQDINGGTIICSSDKDLNQIPGRHYDWKRSVIFGDDGTLVDERQFTVTPEEAERFFWSQVLTGDPSDGYPGVPGIGPKKATVILADCHTASEFWVATAMTYLSHGLTIEDAIRMARLAYILHPWDYDTYRWVPPFDIENDVRYESTIKMLKEKDQNLE